LYKIYIENLSPEDIEPILHKVKGQGGFQDLIKKLQKQYSGEKQTLVLDHHDINRMIRYSKRYGQGGFQDKLSCVLSRIRELNSQLSDLLSE